MKEIRTQIEATEGQIKKLTTRYHKALKGNRVIDIGDLSIEEWLILRSIVGVGSSEIATALGYVPGWFLKTPLKLWKEKIGHIIEIIDTPIMRIGRNVEEAIVQEYEYLTGKKVMRVKDKMFIHPTIDYLFSDLDGIVLPVSGDGYRILECKSTVSYVYDAWKDKLPSYYFRQSMGEIAVINEHPFFEGKKFEGIDFATLILDKREVEILPITIDEKFVAEQTEEICKWYNDYVVANVPPPESAAEWSQAQEYEGSFIEATDKGYKNYLELLKVKKQISLLEEAETELKDEIIKEIKDNENLMFQGEIICSYKSQNRTTVDSKKLKAERPEIFEEYKNVSTSRILRPKKVAVEEY